MSIHESEEHTDSDHIAVEHGFSGHTRNMYRLIL